MMEVCENGNDERQAACCEMSVMEQEKESNDDQSKSGCENEFFSFLHNLKLDMYHADLVEQGAEKLAQLVYVDDAIVDQLTTAVKMKIVHAGVFKKAIKECQNNLREITTSMNLDGMSGGYRTQQQPHPMFSNATPSHIQPERPALVDRRRNPYVFENGTGGSHFHQNLSTPNPMYQLFAAAQAHTQESTTPLIRPFTGGDLANATRSSAIGGEEGGRTFGDLKNGLFSDRNSSSAPIISPQPDCLIPRTNSMVCNDGSYFVSISDRLIKFPASVKTLTLIEKIDQERRELVRRGSQIYGRDDTKRKNNELTPLEVIMNEIAYEICLRDFTFIISRQKLLALVREIIKDNQSLINALGSLNATAANIIAKTQAIRGRNPMPISSSSTIIGPTTPAELATLNQCNENVHFASDYDIILYHKTHREWPLGLSKERRKYLGRRSSNFDLSDNVLYYAKDSRKRRWIFTPEEIKQVFIDHHIDKETGAHYSRETTIERITQSHYCKNASDTITKLYLTCDACRPSGYNVTTPSTTIRLRSQQSATASSDVCFGSNYSGDFQQEDDNDVDMDGNQTQEINIPPPKKSRKSSNPKRLNIDEYHNHIESNLQTSANSSIHTTQQFSEATTNNHSSPSQKSDNGSSGSNTNNLPPLRQT